MNVTKRVGDPGEVRLSVAGELDLSTVDQLQQQVEQELLADRRPQRLVLDLTGLTFCDSTGLSAMLAAQMAGAEHGVAVIVANPRGMTLRVMEATGLLDILTSAGST